MDIETYLKSVYVPSRLNIRPSTVEQYGYAARSLQSFHTGIQVADLCDELVLPWLSARLREVSPRTVKRERGDVLTLWRHACRKGHCETHPIDIPAIQITRRQPAYWTVDELERILVACGSLTGCLRGTAIMRSAWWRSLVLFLYDTGARLSAALAVRPSDLSMANRCVVLSGETAKTRLEQVVNLSDQTIAAVAGHYEATRNAVWPWPYNRRLIWVRLKRVLCEAGLPADRDRMFHCFRRTTATLSAANGSIDVARRQLGHTSEAMTRLYVNESALQQTQAVDVLPRPSI